MRGSGTTSSVSELLAAAGISADQASKLTAGFKGAVGLRPAAQVATRCATIILVGRLVDARFMMESATRANSLQQASLIEMAEELTESASRRWSYVLDARSLEPREIAFLKATRHTDPAELKRFMGHLECAGVLAWTLGWTESIPSVTIEVHVEGLWQLLGKDPDSVQLPVVKARSYEELLQAQRTWMTELLSRISTDDELRSRALERTRAFRWLLDTQVDALTDVDMRL